MYYLNDIEINEKNNLLYILNKKGLYPKIINDELFVICSDNVVFRKKVESLFINDLIDIIGLSVSDSKYLYYLIDIAYDNSVSKVKKKSLWL